MSGTQDTDEIRRQHQDLKARMPHAWNPFFASFGRLRDVQLAAIPPILSGSNVLVTAPTAGGKTQAVMAPTCERVIRDQWQDLSVLLITPTRALVNDLYERLRLPCESMRIKLGRKTADHTLHGQVLITTPESTESMLSFNRKSLDNVHAVVLDEIHLLDGTSRGDQLRLILSRLSAYLRNVGKDHFTGLQRIALSATVSCPRELAERYLGVGSTIVEITGSRRLEAHIVRAGDHVKDQAEAAIDAVDRFEDVRKILVFVNSRKQVDAGASYFRYGRFSSTATYGHHGSLTKSQRENVEERFKNDQHAVCVATMTLEVGIDIGDIDLVICIDPPYSISSFLQRIGRGCRRLKGLTRVLCVARDRAGELMFESFLRQARLGLPPVPASPFRRSVLVQQVLAYLRQVDSHQRTVDQFRRLLTSPSHPPINETCLEEVLADMAGVGLLAKRLGDIFQPASNGWEFIESSRIYSNIQPTPLEVALIDVDSGKVIAKVSQVRTDTGGVRVAGRPYDILPGGTPTKQKVRSGGKHVDVPLYRSRKLPYALDVGAALAGKFGIPPSTITMLCDGDSVILMTWLGSLFNGVLAAGLSVEGVPAAEGPFHLAIRSGDDRDVIGLLRRAVEAVLRTNPLGSMTPETTVDMGPYFRELSPDLQRLAREDWLDREFLRSWVSGIRQTTVVDMDSDLGKDLLELTLV